LQDYVNNPSNHFRMIPSNVGLRDAALTSLVQQYNTGVTERNDMLRTLSDTNPHGGCSE